MQQKFTTLANMVQYVLQTFNNSYALNYRVDDEWQSMSTEVFVESIRRLTLGLYELGIRKGDTVGILARPSPYWLIADLAITSVGAVSVPLFAHVSEKNFIFEVNDASMKALFVVDGDQWAAVSHHRTLFEHVITYNVADADTIEGENVHTFAQLLFMGDQLSGQQPALYAELRDQVRPDDLATIIYTSGSAGVPKGVELTHGNIVSQLQGCYERTLLSPNDDRILSVLPLAHAFERTLMYYYLASGVTVYFADDIRKLPELMIEISPTHCAMVPLMVEKLYSKMESTIKNTPIPFRWIAMRALKVATKPDMGGIFQAERALYDRLIYSKLRESMGGCFKVVSVGGAPLNKELNQFFINIGVPMYQGYGLTESSPILTVNYPAHNKPGTVGRPFPNVEIRISEEGEILAKGPNIMRGYHNETKGTQVRLGKDGWLYTGDLGYFDEQGYLIVTGRKKEIMKLSTGKMVAPLPIEQMLIENSFIDMALVVGHARQHVSALLIPNSDALEQLKKETKLEYLSDEDFLESPAVMLLTEKHLNEVKKRSNEWEHIRTYKYLPTPLTVESGELTSTMKIRRELVSEKYRDEIDAMY